MEPHLANDDLPPKLEARWQKVHLVLRRHAAALAAQGTLASRLAAGRRVWSVRFYQSVGTRRAQRSVYLGSDPRLLKRAEELLREFRRPKVIQEELQVMSRLCNVLLRAVKRAHRRRNGAESRRV